MSFHCDAGVGDRGEDRVDAHLHGRLALEPPERVQADADDGDVVVMSVLLCRRRVRPERRRKAYTNCNYYSNVVPVIEHKPTFCRICEPLCGMIATVEDGRLVSLRPDKEHPLSAGFACQKGIAFTEVHNDPDRVTQPLRRTAAGEFEPVSWESAMSDIAARLDAILAEHGPGAVGWYFGNPGAFSYSHLLWAGIFINGTRPRHALLHRLLAGHQQPHRGQPVALRHADVGADPRSDAHRPAGGDGRQPGCLARQRADRAADQGPHARHRQARRDGCVVIDPRRTETAAQFEWLGIVPDGDAYLLLSLLQVMFAEGLVDRAAVAAQADGLDWLERRCAAVHPRGHPAAHRCRARHACARLPAIWSAPGGPPSTAGSAPAPARTAR